MRFAVVVSWLPLALLACGGAPSTSVLVDASVTADGGPGGNTQTLSCGAGSCSLPAQSCCVYDTTPSTYACVDGPSCPLLDGGGGGGQGTALQCSGAANCPQGTVCCVFEQPNKQVASACQQTCANNQAQLCDPTAAVSGCAADAGACSSANVSDWGLPKGYATCGGVGN